MDILRDEVAAGIAREREKTAIVEGYRPRMKGRDRIAARIAAARDATGSVAGPDAPECRV